MTVLDQPTWLAMQRAVLDALDRTDAPHSVTKAVARAMLELANEQRAKELEAAE